MKKRERFSRVTINKEKNVKGGGVLKEIKSKKKEILLTKFLRKKI